MAKKIPKGLFVSEPHDPSQSLYFCRYGIEIALVPSV